MESVLLLYLFVSIGIFPEPVPTFRSDALAGTHRAPAPCSPLDDARRELPDRRSVSASLRAPIAELLVTIATAES